jgi:2Fe-2S ferredoxin
MTCATCHVYVTDAWQARVPAATAEEQEMLAFAAAERRPGSRLACQITLQPELAGLTVCLPVRQY